MKYGKVIFVVLALLSLFSCEEPLIVEVKHSIWLRNNDTAIRRCLVTYSYPDTNLPEQYRPWEIAGMLIGERIPHDLIEEEYKKLLKNPSKKLCIFIFNGDTIDSYPWSKVRSDYKILKRYDVSLQDIENMGDIVEYP